MENTSLSARDAAGASTPVGQNQTFESGRHNSFMNTRVHLVQATLDEVAALSLFQAERGAEMVEASMSISCAVEGSKLCAKGPRGAKRSVDPARSGRSRALPPSQQFNSEGETRSDQTRDQRVHFLIS